MKTAKKSFSMEQDEIISCLLSEEGIVGKFDGLDFHDTVLLLDGMYKAYLVNNLLWTEEDFQKIAGNFKQVFMQESIPTSALYLLVSRICYTSPLSNLDNKKEKMFISRMRTLVCGETEEKRKRIWNIVNFDANARHVRNKEFLELVSQVKQKEKDFEWTDELIKKLEKMKNKRIEDLPENRPLSAETVKNCLQRKRGIACKFRMHLKDEGWVNRSTEHSMVLAKQIFNLIDEKGFPITETVSKNVRKVLTSNYVDGLAKMYLFMKIAHSGKDGNLNEATGQYRIGNEVFTATRKTALLQDSECSDAIFHIIKCYHRSVHLKNLLITIERNPILSNGDEEFIRKLQWVYSKNKKVED